MTAKQVAGSGLRGATAGLELGDVVRAHAAEYVAWRGGKVSGEERRVLTELAACRTPRMGGHASQCDHCGAWQFFWHSCRNRHCPLCGGAERARWLERCRQDLLPTSYYHTIFTLPRELRRLTLANRKVVYDLLLHATAETLQQVAENPKHLGAQIGFTLVLHTWGQTLQLHPHVHGVVPGGGLSPERTRWVPARKDFFLPVQVLSCLFRGKFLAGLKRAWRKGQLRLEGDLASLADARSWEKWLRPLYGKKWNVYVEPPPREGACQPEAVLKYLARYAWGVAISNSRLESLTEEGVTFRWKDYRHGKQEKTMTLGAVEFLRRFLQQGFVRIRYYGLLSMRQRRRAVPLCRQLLKVANGQAELPCDLPPLPDFSQVAEDSSSQLRTCAICGVGKLRPVRSWPRPTLPQLMPLAWDSHRLPSALAHRPCRPCRVGVRDEGTTQTEVEAFWAQPCGPCCVLPCAPGVVVLLRIAQTSFLGRLKHRVALVVLELGVFSFCRLRCRLAVRKDAAIENTYPARSAVSFNTASILPAPGSVQREGPAPWREREG